MSLLINFSHELRTWILHNLDRGCASADIISSMVAQQFEPTIAQGLVNAFVQARAAGTHPPEEAITIDIAQTTPELTAGMEYHYETSRIKPGSIIHTHDRKISVLIRIEQPVLAVLDGVLSEKECDQLISLARRRLQPSTVVDPATGNNKVATHRNSYGMFFALEETPFIAKLDRRISEIMNWPIENGEGLQVLHYGPQAKNTPHYDFLIPSNRKNEESLARSGQRISSLVIYLNEVIGGGETIFPEIGLAVQPKKGNAVYFEYTNSLQQLDHKSLHAGAEVTSGEKWVVTKWMREKRFIAAEH